MLPMEMLIDLHAAHIDQNRAVFSGVLESLQGVLQSVEIMRLALDVHGEGLQASLPSGLRQADRVEDALRDTIFGRCGTDGALTGSAIGSRFRGTADQGESR